MALTLVAAAIERLGFARSRTRGHATRQGECRAGVDKCDKRVFSSFNGLYHILSREPSTGIGASGIDFFAEPAGLPATDRRDVALLQALRDALDALAGNAFARAFGNSSDQDD